MKPLSPPLLPLTALAAAVFILSSCDKKEPAVSASGNSSVELTGDAAHAEAGRVKSAQRHFLLTGYIWRDSHWRHIGSLIDRFDEYRVAREKLVGAPADDAQRKRLEQDLAQLRAEMDQACSQFENLTPEGQRQWDGWEAKKWAGYKLPKNQEELARPDIFFPVADDRAPDTPQGKAAASFHASREAMYRSLREEARLAADREQELLNQLYRGPKPPPAGPEKDASLAELRKVSAARRDLLMRLRSLYAESEKLHADWTAKNWEGYGMPSTPGNLPDRTPVR